jgi:cell division protein FtsQ
MAKKAKEAEMNLYYMNNGQAQKDDIEAKMKRKKEKEREKRINQNKAIKEEFDVDTETVIQMTNKNKIKKDEEKKRKLTQQEKRRKKRNKKIKFFLKIFLLLAIIIGGISFAMVSPIFNITEIQVLDNEQVSSETVISLSGLKTEENIFKFNSSKIVNSIKENAYIENVKIHRKIPNKIQIEVEEREHTYSADFLGKYAYISKQGYILEISEDSKQKIIIQGIVTPEEQVVVGNRLNDSDLERLEDVMKIMNSAKEYDLDDKVTSIDISDKNEYSIYLEEEGKKVYLGDTSNLSNKMLYVNAILEEEKGKAGEIFVNGDLNNKFKVYFRESLNV